MVLGVFTHFVDGAQVVQATTRHQVIGDLLIRTGHYPGRSQGDGLDFGIFRKGFWSRDLIKRN
ncbi:hypothetical protein N8996_07385 [Candidatus Poseidonia alphae]|nr:hypothetical protein [Candidatus Poseidonia alphae]